MGTKEIIEKIRFRWRAQGRHGTHSPFVYAFVEKVLRTKRQFHNRPKGWSQKQWNLLNATLSYLEPQIIIVEELGVPEVKENLVKIWSEKKVLSLSKFKQSDTNEDLLFVTTSGGSILINEFIAQNPSRFSLYIAQPHKDGAFPGLERFARLAEFKMVIDFWEALLLVKNNNFKEKQFFELR